MQAIIDGIEIKLETPLSKCSTQWESYFAQKSDHYEMLAHIRGEEIKRLNALLNK